MVGLSDIKERGLNDQEVLDSRRRYGRNEQLIRKRNYFDRLRQLVSEPMVVLLLVAALLYFISGSTGDGIFMMFAIILVTGISWYQESRSTKAVEALRSLTTPTCQAIRNGETVEISREDIVVGDLLILHEGTSIPADGLILRSND